MDTNDTFMQLDYEIIAVDFDGTLCENRWPLIGEPNQKLIDALIERQKNGSKIILWTCRVGMELKNALDWCLSHGLNFDAVNNNLPEVINMYGRDSRKIFAHTYIDDKGVDIRSFTDVEKTEEIKE